MGMQLNHDQTRRMPEPDTEADGLAVLVHRYDDLNGTRVTTWSAEKVRQSSCSMSFLKAGWNGHRPPTTLSLRPPRCCRSDQAIQHPENLGRFVLPKVVAGVTFKEGTEVIGNFADGRLIAAVTPVRS